MVKRKRAPGQGRKPTGPISGKSAVFATRIRPDTRDAIAAEALARGWSLSQAAERILLAGIDTLRERNTVNSTQALRMLVGMIADDCSIKPSQKRYDWDKDQFTFDAFKIALNAMLDQLRPASSDLAQDREQLDPAWHRILRSPETLADNVFLGVWEDLHRIQPISPDEAATKLDMDSELSGVWSRHTHTLAKIRRDLPILEQKS